MKPSPEFILELVERANDRFLDRLEGLNAVLVGELAATLGIGGVLIDKYSDLGRGLIWLGIAYVLSATGLVVGSLFSRPPEAPHPIEAIILLEKRPDGVARLTATIAESWKQFQWLRGFKTVCVAAALVFLTLGTVVALGEKVVESHHGTNARDQRARGNASSGGPVASKIRHYGRPNRSGVVRPL